MSCALSTDFALEEVKRASILTFHLVANQVRACIVKIEPAQTKVHSDP